MSQTAILGAGVMGETLLSGLVRAGRRVDHLLIGEKRPERARELEERYGVAVVSNVEAARKAETLALVVKPQDMGDLLDEIAGVLRPGQLVVSLAAGITTAFIESRVPAPLFSSASNSSGWVVMPAPRPTSSTCERS